MPQSERRIYLLRELLKEQPRYQDIRIPTNKQEQKNLLRSLFNIRMPAPVSDAFLKIQNEYLQEESARKWITDIADLTPYRATCICSGAILQRSAAGPSSMLPSAKCRSASGPVTAASTMRFTPTPTFSFGPLVQRS